MFLSGFGKLLYYGDRKNYQERFVFVFKQLSMICTNHNMKKESHQVKQGVIYMEIHLTMKK